MEQKTRLVHVCHLRQQQTKHSTVVAVAERPGEVQRIRDTTLAADVLIYNFIFFCLNLLHG